MTSAANSLHNPKSTARSDRGVTGLAEELAKLISASPAALKLIAAAMEEKHPKPLTVSTRCPRCDTKPKAIEATLPSTELDDPLVPLEIVKQIAGIGRTKIYSLIREEAFPKPFKPGGASSRWSLAEVKRWRDEQRAR